MGKHVELIIEDSEVTEVRQIALQLNTEEFLINKARAVLNSILICFPIGSKKDAEQIRQAFIAIFDRVDLSEYSELWTK